jgi:hypothetical protein
VGQSLYDGQMSALRSRFICEVPSPDGRQADVAIIEANGDEHIVRCLIRPNLTEIGGDFEIVQYLNERYGEEAVCRAALAATLGL